jgi:hypothetical protein
MATPGILRCEEIARIRAAVGEALGHLSPDEVLLADMVRHDVTLLATRVWKLAPDLLGRTMTVRDATIFRATAAHFVQAAGDTIVAEATSSTGAGDG